MAIEGVDYSWGRPSVDQLRAAGKRFVCRYLSDPGGKGITRQEFGALRGGGIDVVLNHETTGTEMRGGRAAGVREAQAAERLRQAQGIPEAPIYFSCDWDATPSDQTAINAYLDGAASVIGLARVGVYGSVYVVARAFDAGKTTYGWQTYAWSGGKWDPRAQLQQYSNGRKIAGQDVDFTRAMVPQFGQVGGAVTGSPAAAAAPAAGRNTTGRSTADVQRLVGSNPDGVYGPDTTAKVRAWQAAHGLTADGVWGPASDARGFPPAPGLPVLRNGSRDAAVSRLQAGLKRVFPLYAGKLAVDGIYGPATAAAVREFQKRSGIASDGVVGVATWGKLAQYGIR